MSNELQKPSAELSTIERVLIQGDLAKITAEERARYYAQVCESLGLNPFTRPFEYINLNGQLKLYARRDCTDQLRRRDCVNISILARERLQDVYVVSVRATLPNGRTDESTGVVSLANLKGDALANALMKAETKAKRRATLSICGLGFLDETEAETITAGEVSQAPLPPALPNVPENPTIQAEQVGILLRLCKQAGKDPGDMAEWVSQRRTRVAGELTPDEWSRAKRALEFALSKRPQPQPQPAPQHGDAYEGPEADYPGDQVLGQVTVS